MKEKTRLQKKYKDTIIPKLIKELKLSNVMEVPGIKKIIINAGIGDFKDSESAVEGFAQELTNLAGQRPTPRKAKKAISGFGIQKGDVVGYAVTLRKERMWVFLDKFINIVLPRVRDFRGLSLESFDQEGNYSIGLDEHTIFPEVNPNKTKGTRSLQVTIVTNTEDVKKSKELLSLIGLPFKKEEK